MISYSKVELWEGVLTIAFFPLFVINCYVVDSRFFQKLYQRYVLGDKKAFAAHVEGDDHNIEHMIEIIKRVRQQNPEATPDEIVGMAEMELLKKAPKSQAFYRLQANSKMLGGGDLIKKHEQGEQQKLQCAKQQNEDVLIHFDDTETSCMENAGTHHVNVICQRFKRMQRIQTFFKLLYNSIQLIHLSVISVQIF